MSRAISGFSPRQRRLDFNVVGHGIHAINRFGRTFRYNSLVVVVNKTAEGNHALPCGNRDIPRHGLPIRIPIDLHCYGAAQPTVRFGLRLHGNSSMTNGAIQSPGRKPLKVLYFKSGCGGRVVF